MIIRLHYLLFISIFLLPACIFQEQKKTISSMKYQELKKRKEELAAANDLDTMILYLQKMVPLCQDLQELRTILIELADLLFDRGKLTEAEKLYREYSRLYPSDEHAEYAHYKAILCCFYKTLDSTRDQTKTHETIELAQQFLERKSLFTKYSHEVEKIVVACNERLAQSELSIIAFYTKRGKYRSSEHRINQFRKDWIEKTPQMEAPFIYQEYQLALAQDNQQVKAQKHKTLLEKFPAHPLTLTLGQQEIKKKPVIRRL